MSTQINIHDIMEVREKITHYTRGIKFVCRNIIIKDSKGAEITISMFSEQDERAVSPLTVKREYVNA